MISILIQKYKSVKLKYLSQNPYEKCAVVHRVVGALLRAVDFCILDADYRVTALTIFVGSLPVFYILSMFYTMFHFRNEPLRAMQATTLGGIIVSVSNENSNEDNAIFKKIVFFDQ